MFQDKPLICVSMASNVQENLFDGKARNIRIGKVYTSAVARAGGIPILGPEDCAEEIAQMCDGLLLSGGPDIHPSHYGQQSWKEPWPFDYPRDAYELALFQAFKKAGKPILGICRGEQVINVALGGTLIQDLPSMTGFIHQVPNDWHYHPCKAEPGSLLADMYGTDFWVNSWHHQAVDRLAPGLKATAWSVEGLVEAYEHETLPIWGVQFHPEELSGPNHKGPTPDFQPFFDWFIETVKKHAEK